MARDFLASPISAILSKSTINGEATKVNPSFNGLEARDHRGFYMWTDWLESLENKQVHKDMTDSRKQHEDSEHQMLRHQAGPFKEYAYDTSECTSFAKKHMYRENYMSALFSCEKMYVPVFDKERRHFYLFVLHMKKQVVEIWDSLAKSSGSSVDKRLPNMLAILDILFEDDIQQNYPDGWSFASFSVDRSPNVPQQTNGYDCGVYVIKFMLAPEEVTQPDFVFDSDTERLDVVLGLLDGNVNSCRNELAAKAEAYFLRSSGTNDSLRIWMRRQQTNIAC
uniref:Ubiquitin-like protease family profile domain-containing protein n=1 Tax=Populus alba TaxID=43335 RepID=A0A4U5PVT6_POPAL|nr:hypothetical protein D5086_0000170660 [Populus alba]